MLFGETNEELGLIPEDTCSGRALTLLAIVAPTLFPCNLESGVDLSVYNP